jgi:hypothetical protein
MSVLWSPLQRRVYQRGMQRKHIVCIEYVFPIGVHLSTYYFMYGTVFDEEFGVVSIPTNFLSYGACTSVEIVHWLSWGMWRVVGCHLGFRASSRVISPIHFLYAIYNCWEEPPTAVFTLPRVYIQSVRLSAYYCRMIVISALSHVATKLIVYFDHSVCLHWKKLASF